jgi:hypothetical protein
MTEKKGECFLVANFSMEMVESLLQSGQLKTGGNGKIILKCKS